MSHLKLIPRFTMNTCLTGYPSRSYCKCAQKSLGLYAHVLYRKNNALVLSEELEENVVEILVRIAVKGIFPESCARWRTAKKEIGSRCKQELVKKEDTVRQEVARGEGSLRRALHEAVTKDVMKLFPYDSVTSSKARIANALAYCRSIERDHLSRPRDDLGTDPEASGKRSV
jgi:hypothetical protein